MHLHNIIWQLLYQIALKVDCSQEMEVLETREALNSVTGQIQNLQVVESLEIFNFVDHIARLKNKHMK